MLPQNMKPTPALEAGPPRRSAGPVDWFAVSRSIVDHRVFEHDGIFRLWMYLLARANWRDGSWTPPGARSEIPIRRGQLIVGQKALHAALYGPDYRGSKPDSRTVWRWLDRIQQFGSIVSKNVSNRFTLVTIVNYDTYQLKPGGACPTGSTGGRPGQCPDTAHTLNNKTIQQSSSPKPPPVAPGPPAADWGVVEEKLIGLGLAKAQDAIQAAQDHGAAPVHILELIGHYLAHPNAWGPGALFSRIGTWRPGQDPGSLWPPRESNGNAAGRTPGCDTPQDAFEFLTSGWIHQTDAEKFLEHAEKRYGPAMRDTAADLGGVEWFRGVDVRNRSARLSEFRGGHSCGGCHMRANEFHHVHRSSRSLDGQGLARRPAVGLVGDFPSDPPRGRLALCCCPTHGIWRSGGRSRWGLFLFRAWAGPSGSPQLFRSPSAPHGPGSHPLYKTRGFGSFLGVSSLDPRGNRPVSTQTLFLGGTRVRFAHEFKAFIGFFGDDHTPSPGKAT